MATGTKPAWNPEPVRPSSRPIAPLFKFLPFLLIGVVGSIVGGWLVMTKGVNLGLVSLAMILALPAMWAAWVGAKEVRRVLSAFWPRVKWWHWVWFLSVISGFVFRYRSASEISQSPVDSTAALRLGPEVIVLCILAARLVFRKPDWGPSMTRGIVGSMAAFGAVCLLSSLWSVKFSWTAYKSIEYLLDLSIVAVVLAIVRTSEEYKTFIDWTWVIAAAGVAWVWIGLPIWPGPTWFDELRLSGAIPVYSSNELGDTGAILVLVAAIRYWPVKGQCKNRMFYILVGLMGALTMLAAQTRSALGGLAVAALVVLFLAGRTRYAIWGAIMGVPAIIFTSLGPKIMQYLERDQSAEELATMSSRLNWWSIAYKMFMTHPFTGLGAYAGSRFAVLANIGAPQLHSDWLEVIVGTSIWGLTPFLISIVWIWVTLIRFYRGNRIDAADKQLTLEMIGVMTMLTIHSFVNVEMTWHHPTLFLMILGWAEFMRRRMKARAPVTAQLRMATVPSEQLREPQRLKARWDF
jgi:O-antigen ligase